ncbi:MAG: hypothetical protein GXX83_07755 [Gaiellales bacterium]|nr:hypothetical protein [Gaiellales bacterium]
MMKKCAALLFLVLVVAVGVVAGGCGGSEGDTTTSGEAVTTTADAGEETTTTAAAEEEPTGDEPSITRAADLSDTIVLPAGFAMNDAVTVADVEAVVGKTGYVPFPEANSNAAAGSPEGSFLLAGDPASKIRFSVWAKDGQAKYDTGLKFVKNPEEVAADIWDKLIVGDAESGTEVTTLVLRGDVCMRIMWNAEYYGDFDRLDLGARLADMFVAKLFKE